MPHKITQETVVFSFQPEPGALKKDVKIAMAHQPNEVAPNIVATPDVVLFAGLGNEGRIPLKAAKRMGKLGLKGIIAVEALPYWHAQPTEAGLTKLAVDASTAVATHTRERHFSDKLHAIGESQAALGLLETAVENPDAFDGRLALLRPLGFQGDMSRAKFMGRMVRTGLQIDQLSDPLTTNTVAAHAAHRVGQDVLRGGKQLDFALNYDGSTDLQKLIVAGRSVLVFGAERDRLFPPAELEPVINGVGGELAIIPGSHSSPTSRSGVRQLEPVVAWCRSE